LNDVDVDDSLSAITSFFKLDLVLDADDDVGDDGDDGRENEKAD